MPRHAGLRTTTSLLLVAALALAACSGNGAAPRAGATTSPSTVAATVPASTVPSTSPAGAAGADLKGARPRLEKVASIPQPTAMAVRPGDDAVYVAGKTGRVVRVPAGQTDHPAAPDVTPVLDLTGQVTGGTEQGLLGLTFSPDGSKLYVDYTDTNGDTRVVEYGFAGGGAEPSSRRQVLFVHQPYANHNGGEVAFGPDGKLYVGLGDGGSERDPDGIGQNLGTPLAKILRIDPAPSGNLQYTIPADNPFVGRAGARPETWVWGLRNPWRFSWDRATGDLWIGDVGQDRWEEVDYLPAGTAAGSNLGWSAMEATHRFKGDNPPGAKLPIAEYSHDGGNCSITGGYVYRGAKVPALDGAYIYGDACSGKVWGLVQSGGKVVDQRELTIAGLAEATGSGSFSISSFGEDSAGELYLLSLDGGVYRFET